MNVARRLAEQGAVGGTCVTARMQTAGRGRRGRTWSSPRDAGLYLTAIVRPRGAVVQLPQLALVAAVCVIEALDSLLPGEVAQWLRLKWPNDVLAPTRKLAGILVEGEGSVGAQPYLLIGIGLNLQSALALPNLQDDVAARYVGLSELCSDQPPPSRLSLAKTLMTHLHGAVSQWEKAGLAPFLPRWNRSDALCGQLVRAEVDGATIVGTARGVDAVGRLRVEQEHMCSLIRAGEVTQVAWRDTLARLRLRTAR